MANPPLMSDPGPMASQIQAPAAPAAPSIRMGSTVVEDPLQNPENYRYVKPETADVLAEDEFDKTGSVSPELERQMTDAGREKLMQKARRKDFDKYVNSPVQVPYSPAQPDRTLPTTSSESISGAANAPQIRGAYDQAAASRDLATAARADYEQKRLQEQLLVTTRRRQQLEQEVSAREAKLSEIQSAADAAKQKALNMREQVRSRQIDSGRLFREKPWAAAAAMFADVMFALAGQARTGDQNTVWQLVARDTQLQRMEIEKLGMDADNALADVAVEFDGNLDAAEAALNIAKSQAIENQMAAQAAAMGLKELPVAVLEMFAKNDLERAKEEEKIGESTKIQKSQSMKFIEGRAASGGYRRPATDEERLKRAKGYNELTQQALTAETGLTQEQRFELDKKNAEQGVADPELVQKYGVKREEIERSVVATEDLKNRLKEQIAKYGTVPGWHLADETIPSKLYRQGANQIFGAERQKDALENRRLLSKVLMDAQSAIPGVPSEKDMEMMIATIKGSGTLDEKLNAVADLNKSLTTSVDTWGAAFGKPVVDQYMRNRAEIIKDEPKEPVPRGMSQGKLNARQEELIRRLEGEK
jgi:hypothetical protein